MVRLSPDVRRQEILNQLEEEKDKVRKELEEREKKLEATIQEISENLQREEIETERTGETDGETETPEETAEGIPLEERVGEEEQMMREGGGPAYEVRGSDLENLPDLYDQVKQDVEAGRFMSENVQSAMNMIYHLNKQEEEYSVSWDAHRMVERDREDAQYVNRLQSLFDQIEQQSSIKYQQ